MNPLFKTCLLAESPTKSVRSVKSRDTEYTDPYSDDNDFSLSSKRSTDGNNLNSYITPQLGENMMRTNVNRDPYEVYQFSKLLGNGSMGSVAMVKKRNDTVGGSARVKNLSTRRRLEMHSVHPVAVNICMLPILGSWFETCTGLEEYTKNTAFAPLNTTSVDSEDGAGIDGSGALSPSSSMDGSRASSLGDRIAPSLHTSGLRLDNSLHHTANHLRIKKYIDKQRAKGKYEPYYALKSIHLDRVHDPLFVNELRNEIAIMKRLDHAHIVRPIETYESRGHLYMVMELCSGGDLYTRDPYTEDQAARIVSGVISAVAYMHEHNIIHRDLKYENVMFVNNGPKAEIKIIDFGLSKKYLPNVSMKEGVGTVYTMSPQVLEGAYNESADLWAIGVLAYMLLSSQMPFYGRKRREILEKIMKCEYDFVGRRWSAVSSQAKNFVSDLLQFKPEARPSAHEARQCLWLNMKMNSSVRTATEDDMDMVAYSIESYSNKRTLQKLALMVIAHKSTSEEIGFLRKVFKRYDTDKSGAISLDEFKQCLSKYGYNDDYVESLFQAADLDGTGSIKYTEFLAATIDATGLVTEDRLAEAFDRLDSDDSGYISFENLREILGEDVAEEYIDQIITEADFEKNNKVSYQEFLAMWKDELVERQIEGLSGINKKRTVSAIADMLDESDDEGRR